MSQSETALFTAARQKFKITKQLKQGDFFCQHEMREGPLLKIQDDMNSDGLKSVTNDIIHPIKNGEYIAKKCLTYGRGDKK